MRSRQRLCSAGRRIVSSVSRGASSQPGLQGVGIRLPIPASVDQSPASGTVGFAEAALAAFEFVTTEYGLRVEGTDDYDVHFASDRVRLGIHHGRNSYELTAWIEQRESENRAPYTCLRSHGSPSSYRNGGGRLVVWTVGQAEEVAPSRDHEQPG
jgi:hypothetical protein